ncbi:MAG: ImmA/IrrE family metallo-endopeptidase [Hyphomicrobiales bacterium]|nr:ImmA/IrrE family metallo-endopeptidase [Hyphomicrobiales bacterium]
MLRASRLLHGALLTGAVLLALSLQANAQIYSRVDLEAEAVRLRNAVFRIYSIGIKPSLTEEEVRAASDFEFSFPFPTPDDPLMDSAATTDGRTMIMPVMSLKALEDLATAYAWLQVNNYNHSAIDLYFTMLRYRDRADFPDGRFPRLLEALGVPPDAYKTDKRVDELSLSLRNEAFAFIIAHELAHIIYRHKPINAISAEQARADEREADAFALDIMLRTNTPPLGAFLFFQAQIYNLLHPVEFGNTQEEKASVLLQMTHPLSLDRVREMIEFVEGPFARARPEETEIWSGIGSDMRQILPLMEDKDLAACVIKLAREASPDSLKPRRTVETEAMLKICRQNQ